MRNSVIQLSQNRFAGLAADALNHVEQQTLVDMALKVLESRYQPGEYLSSPASVAHYLQLRLAGRKAEVFACLFLDTRHRVICMDEMFHGTVSGAAVYPRVVVQRALEVNAVAVILTHNHPSGIAEPSSADIAITKLLQDALRLVDIRVLDHIVVGAAESVSFAEKGLL